MRITGIAIEKAHRTLSNRFILRLALLVFACLVLLACLGAALFTGSLASAQSEEDPQAAWSATLTVGTDTSYVPAITGYSTGEMRWERSPASHVRWMNDHIVC